MTILSLTTIFEFLIEYVPSAVVPAFLVYVVYKHFISLLETTKKDSEQYLSQITRAYENRIRDIMESSEKLRDQNDVLIERHSEMLDKFHEATNNFASIVDRHRSEQKAGVDKISDRVNDIYDSLKR